MVFIQCNKEMQKALCKAKKPYRGLILCFLEDGKHTCTDAAGFGAGTGDLMRINSVGGVGIRMAQLVGGGHGIDTAAIKMDATV